MLFRSVVKSHTRNNKILDKCYTKVKNGYTQCRQLAKLGGSDHFVMQLVPSYIPLSKNKPVKLTRRDYSEENCDNLKACLDTTIWDNINLKMTLLTSKLKFSQTILNSVPTYAYPPRP